MSSASLERSSGVGSIEQNVQNKSVASLEARSSGSRTDYIGSYFLSEFVVIYVIMWCITQMFIVMFIVIVIWGVKGALW